jgi:CIC family chloride channel protein
VDANELFAYAALGILAGLVALAFIRVLYGSEDLFDKLRISTPVKAMLGGTLIGLIGVWVPHVFGVGYEAINEALNGNIVWQFMLLLVVAKIVAVSITIGSGGSGGVFAPSLFIGAMLGGAAGTVVHTLWPASTAAPGAYALVGMGAVVAAGTHAPITAILIIFELTGSYTIILPLMISCIIATLLATRLQRGSIYTLKLLRRGVDLQRGKAVNVLQNVRVREVMRPDAVTVSPEAGLATLISRFIDHSGSTLFVTDEQGELEGIITVDQIRPLMKDPSALAQLIIAQDVMVEGEFPQVGPADPLANVMRFMETYRGEVPVLESDRIVGVIWPGDVIGRYHTEVFKRDMAGTMASALGPESGHEKVAATIDSVVAEVNAPSRFIGRTIRELDIRQRFGISILVIKRQLPDGAEELSTRPDADYTFKQGDVMLALGSEKELRHLRRGIPPRETRAEQS